MMKLPSFVCLFSIGFTVFNLPGIKAECELAMRRFCSFERFCPMFRPDVRLRCQRDCGACLPPASTAATASTGRATAVSMAPVGVRNAAPPQCDKPASSNTVQALYSDVSAFSWSLFNVARRTSTTGNVFVSPMSVALALAMVQAGAQSNTLAQIDAALTPSVRSHTEKLSAFKQLMDDINAPNQGYNLSTANAIFAQQDMEMLDDFVRAVTGCLQGEAMVVDFVRKFEAIRSQINTWVEEKTNNKIRDLLQPGTLTSLTRMVLVNAIYFKGDWLTPFDSANRGVTYDGFFRPPTGSRQPVKFMSREGQYPYYEDQSVQVLGLPYKGRSLSMYVVLPKEGTNLDAALTDAAAMQRWVDKAQQRTVQVHVHLPKFKMTETLDLKRVLAELGMTDMFSPRNADFSRMTGQKDLYVSKAVHKAFIEVNERGTEAAAATAFAMTEMSAMVDPVPVFVADRPFMFMIRRNDKRDAPMLFVGTLSRLQ